MKVVMVIESWFGNTRAIGQAAADGLSAGNAEVNVVGIDDAPAVIADDVDLLVVGVPTHNRGLSTVATRRQAVSAGGDAAQRGAREWLAETELPAGLNIAVFDTTTSSGWLSGSAAKAASRILERRAPGRHVETTSFLVGGTKGPLVDGEIDAARAWGRQLTAG